MVLLAIAVLIGMGIGLTRPLAGAHSVRPRIEQLPLLGVGAALNVASALLDGSAATLELQGLSADGEVHSITVGPDERIRRHAVQSSLGVDGDLLLGQPFGAEKAHAAGIVTEIVPEEKLLDHARAAAAAIAALPPASVRLTKQLLKRQLMAPIAAQMEEEGRIFADRLQSGEAKEAMTAFFEKRKPDFSRF